MMSLNILNAMRNVFMSASPKQIEMERAHETQELRELETRVALDEYYEAVSGPSATEFINPWKYVVETSTDPFSGIDDKTGGIFLCENRYLYSIWKRSL